MTLHVEEIDGIIYIDFGEELDEATFEIANEHINRYLDENRSGLLLCNDLTKLQYASSEIRTRWANLIKPLRPYIKKNAIFGVSNPIHRAAVTVLLTLARRNDVKLFDNKDAAVNWLNE